MGSRVSLNPALARLRLLAGLVLRHTLASQPLPVGGMGALRSTVLSLREYGKGGEWMGVSLPS